VHERQRFDAAAAATLRKTLQQLLESLARGEDPRSARAPVE
jgi:hypothetical protein